ncbi:MAG: dephospho-CoA kinase [Thermoprotei archaeon]|nr:MAG: dephospho-CoA kinase [Thermoprotei archaeon]
MVRYLSSDRCIILVAGLPGSGKSVLTEVARRAGIPVIVMGDIVREELARRRLEFTAQNLLKVAQELRNIYGPEAIAVLTSNKIDSIRSPFVVVDGVRSLDELNFFKKKFQKVLLVAIHASPHTRFRRIVQRHREGDPRNWEEFVERDLKELSWGLGNVIALADIMLINEGEIQNFVEECRKILLWALREWCS